MAAPALSVSPDFTQNKTTNEVFLKSVDNPVHANRPFSRFSSLHRYAGQCRVVVFEGCPDSAFQFKASSLPEHKVFWHGVLGVEFEWCGLVPMFDPDPLANSFEILYQHVKDV